MTEVKEKFSFRYTRGLIAHKGMQLDGQTSFRVLNAADETVFWYQANYLSKQEQDDLVSKTSSLPFKDEKAFFGHPPTHQTAWLGEYDYKYSGTFKSKAARPAWLVQLSERIAQTTNDQFEKPTGVHVHYRGVLVNKYRKGNDSISKHKDGEDTLNNRAMIAGLNLGATRTLELHVDKGVVVRVRIVSGSLYHFGSRLVHSVPKEPEVQGARFNFTFREEAESSAGASSTKKRAADDAQLPAEPAAKRAKVDTV